MPFAEVARCVCSGSGKTLAYLLPLVQALRTEEASHNDAMTLRNSPRVIVLAPTAELCSQACLRACFLLVYR